MGVVTFHEVEQALRGSDPVTLREMAHQLAHSRDVLEAVERFIQGDLPNLTDRLR